MATPEFLPTRKSILSLAYYNFPLEEAEPKPKNFFFYISKL